eukprot:CAMPEP_0197852342 /NCGR_PEP_ID=MMETSP1438-20131217/20320_1 /TAXON_ID=1461541 /ORGANISM="Pterosperma sp., Strain CCMP1384" /LENGTH=889 /DNA_ID=CAMNT_0043466339 /DNA_START=178 /DNA_END=2844 /DNA_ORIENTATION=+
MATPPSGQDISNDTDLDEWVDIPSNGAPTPNTNNAIGSVQPTPSAPSAGAPVTSPAASGVLSSHFIRTGQTTAQLQITAGLPQRENPAALPADVVVVVDTSGSMGSVASLATDSGVESTGLTLLDVVKHACKTVVSSLGEHDRFSLVEFDYSAATKFELQPMTAANKTAALAAVTSLSAGGSTNLWDGLHTGMEALRNATEATTGSNQRTQSVLLLTDGIPNVVPPRGHLPMMKQYKDTHGMRARVSTFGFGYALDSELLHELAQEGEGTYAFIPDASFVGTVFVNALSNHRSIGAVNAEISIGINDPEAVQLSGAPGGYNLISTSWGGNVAIGTLPLDTCRHVIVDLTLGPKAAVKIADYGDKPDGNDGLKDTEWWGRLFDLHLKYEPCVQPADFREVRVSANTPPVLVTSTAARLDQAMRARLVDAITSVMDSTSVQHAMSRSTLDLTHSQTLIQTLKEDLAAAAARSQSAYIADLAKDVEGQVTAAVSRSDWFQRWGRHYLPSLARAHQLEECNNFKDPGVQGYGGCLFKSLQDSADKLFLKLPPPQPSRPPRRASSSGSCRSAAAPAAPSRSFGSMFYNSRNPCFHGECQVSMADGSTKPAADIRAGDQVLGQTEETEGTKHATGSRHNGMGMHQSVQSARIVCVVKTNSDSTNRTDLVELTSGLKVTPWHPVYWEDKWQFPADVAEVRNMECSAVYSFVLEEGRSVMTIDGVKCVSLGHGRTDDDVIAHEYFGSRAKVIQDLEKMVGWEEGLVELEANECMVRSPTTGLVCGLRQRSAINHDIGTWSNMKRRGGVPSVNFPTNIKLNSEEASGGGGAVQVQRSNSISRTPLGALRVNANTNSVGELGLLHPEQSLHSEDSFGPHRNELVHEESFGPHHGNNDMW